MTRSRIELSNVSVRFRMSYDVVNNFSSHVSSLFRRTLKREKPKEFVALSNLSLRAGDGDIVGIIGANGAGKSTLLRVICGIFDPDRGSARTDGQVSMLLSLGTGFDTQLSGLDNIRLNGLIMGMTRSEIESKIDQIAAFADIGDHLIVPMKYYSNGMISRLSFSMVLAIQPDILVIDEVFSVGDLAFKSKSENAMHELLQKATCQVIATHDLEFVRRHCNRALLLDRGSLIIDGAPDEVVATYEARVREASGESEDVALSGA